MMFQVTGLVKLASISSRRTLLSQAFAGEVDPVGVVDYAIKDRIGECRDADHIVPAVDRDSAVIMREPASKSSSTISRRSRACSGVSVQGPNRRVSAIWRERSCVGAWRNVHRHARPRDR